jgi:heme/copper-type cytochrome/quinol oxidase subunit 2
VSSATKSFLIGGILTLSGLPQALACATCYGASDSPLAQGMNWGIMVLLACIGTVLLGVVGFFVYLIRRAQLLAQTAGVTPLPDSKS